MTKPSRIAFGSCNDQEDQNNLWPILASRQPEAFIWGGDAIYADFKGPKDWSSFPPMSTHECATPERLRRLYRKQQGIPGYTNLVQQNVTIFGTYDDHDYGCNNADREYEFRHESSLAFVDFIRQPEGSAMRRRAEAGRGVYGVKLFDFARPGNNKEVPEREAGIDGDIPFGLSRQAISNQTVAVFVLDVRSNKVPWRTDSGRLSPDFEGDFLGETQWKWFEESIRRSRASVNVIVNGLQVFANRFPDPNVAESWTHFPRAQQRLLDTVLDDNIESPILISGDVHMTQLMRKDCVRKGETIASRSVIEMTTRYVSKMRDASVFLTAHFSGMTHSWGTVPTPLNEPTYKPPVLARIQTLASNYLLYTLHYLCPWTDIMDSRSSKSSRSLYENGGAEGAIQGRQFSLKKNFGELEFDWSDRTVTLRTMGEDATGPPLLAAKVSMDQLSGRANIPGSYLRSADFETETNTPRHQLFDSDWVCINHRGRDTNVAHIFGHASTAGVLVATCAAPVFLVLYLVAHFTRSGSFRSTTDNVSKSERVALISSR